MEAKRQASRTTVKLTPLAFPKGSKKLCELCQRQAHLQCSRCQVTFYCRTIDAAEQQLTTIFSLAFVDHVTNPFTVVAVLRESRLVRRERNSWKRNDHCVHLQTQLQTVKWCLLKSSMAQNGGVESDEDHQQADWVGIHERICQLLVPIRTPTLHSLKQAGRIEMQCKKVELIEICRSVAQSKLSERKHQEALPAAQFCLRCSIDVHGPSNIQLVPAYLLLADANMGLGNLALVTELLSQAEWAVLKSPDCGHAVHHQLHRSLGRLHMATGNLEAALLNFANDVYFASEEYGIDSTVTCAGYFLMADVFAKQGKVMIARSLYSQVAHTWYCNLTKIFKTHVQNVPKTSYETSNDKPQQVEVDEMLRTMLEFEQNDPRKDSAQIALVAHCLAMLWFLGGDSVKALEFGSTALQAIQLIPNHDLTEPIQVLLQLVRGVQTDPHPGSE